MQGHSRCIFNRTTAHLRLLKTRAAPTHMILWLMTHMLSQIIRHHSLIALFSDVRMHMCCECPPVPSSDLKA
jgi:hypothetical protein